MNHEFRASQLDPDTCMLCKHDEIAHGDKAECDSCVYVGTVEVFANMILCPTCFDREVKLAKEVQAKTNEVLQQSRTTDGNIQIKTDLFNAGTTAIVELKAAIDQNDDIPQDQKKYTLFSMLEERQKKFKMVIFEKKVEIVRIENEERANLINLRQLAAELGTEYQEKIKALDVTYTPVSPKVPKPREPKQGRKFLKEEVRKWAGHYDVPMESVQMMVVARNMSPENAAKHLRESFDKVTKGE